MLSIPAFLAERARATPERPALTWREGRSRRQITYGELLGLVDRFARGLVREGVRPGDRIYLFADNSPRWIVADLGILAAGAVSVPRGADTSSEESDFILRHSGADTVVAADAAALLKLPEDGSRFRARILLSGAAEGTLRFEEVLTRGESAPAPEGGTEIATIVYTSGTTGMPKGVMLTHENVLHNVRVLPDLLGVGPGDVFLSVLPSWHMFERTVEYIVLSSGASLSYSGPRTLRIDLLEERPTFLAAVPRLTTSLLDAFVTRLERRNGPSGTLARFLLSRSVAWCGHRKRLRHEMEEPNNRSGHSRLASGFGSVLGAPLGHLGRKVVGAQFRAALGGRVRAVICGGGLLPLSADLFLEALGVPVLVGYGLTETSPVVALRRPGRNVLGTIGSPVPETEIRIVDQEGRPVPARTAGELLVRGPQVMRGYYRDEDGTRSVIDPGGWLRTGDLVIRTERDDLVFAGRRKETIVLSSGENVEPAPIEGRILESPYVRQVVVVGQDRKSLGALVVPERDRASAEARARGIGIEDLLGSEVRRLVSTRAGFKPRETVKRVRLVETEFTVEEGTLTRTMKLRRDVILERFAREIEELFGSAK